MYLIQECMEKKVLVYRLIAPTVLESAVDNKKVNLEPQTEVSRSLP